MTSSLRWAPIGIALLLVVSVPASAVEAIAAYDDYNVRSAIILACHPAQGPADRDYLAKGEALHRAALRQLWAQLDAKEPAQHEQNGRKAQEMLRYQREIRAYDISEQVRAYGCDWLDGRL